MTTQQAAWQHRPDLVDLEFSRSGEYPHSMILQPGPNKSTRADEHRPDKILALAVIAAILALLFL